MNTVRQSTRAAFAAAGVALTLLIGLALAPQASAADYRFWGYWQLKDSKWAFAPKGADQIKPADGSVDGWRWAISGETDARTPRGTVTFDAVCKDTKAKDGTKRVAVVIDYGRAVDAESGKPKAPEAECAQVPTDATSAAALAAVSTVRTDKAMVCGIDSWPGAGCGGEVKSVSAAAKAADDKASIAINKDDSEDSRTVLWASIAAAALILLALGGMLLRLRRRRATEVG